MAAQYKSPSDNPERNEVLEPKWTDNLTDATCTENRNELLSAKHGA